VNISSLCYVHNISV